MKNAIVKSSLNSITGYKIVFTDENNIVTEIEINDTDPKNERILKLPENPSNRKWLSVDKIIKNGGELELDYKETRTIENRGPRKSLEDYMTDEEKKIIEDIMNKARERKEADKKKPLTEKEKLLEKIRRLQAKVDELNTEDED